MAHADGRYWMYYSRGVGDTGHQLRVASSASPTGPFEDVGDVLTPDLPFAIDPSPYRDRDRHAGGCSTPPTSSRVTGPVPSSPCSGCST